jgi:hypothetical protein
MAPKPLEIHHGALGELKSALRWYLERSEGAADAFVAENRPRYRIDRSHSARWPSGELGTRR